MVVPAVAVGRTVERDAVDGRRDPRRSSPTHRHCRLLPALSVQLAPTEPPPPIVPELQEAMPERLSLPDAWKSTGWLYQLPESGPRASEARHRRRRRVVLDRPGSSQAPLTFPALSVQRSGECRTSTCRADRRWSRCNQRDPMSRPIAVEVDSYRMVVPPVRIGPSGDAPVTAGRQSRPVLIESGCRRVGGSSVRNSPHN